MCSPLPDSTLFKCMITFLMEGSWKLGFWRVFLVPDVPVTVPSLGSSHQPQAFSFLSQEAQVPSGRCYPFSPSSSLSAFGAFLFPPTSLLLCSFHPRPPFPFQWYSQSRFWGCFIGSCPAVSTEAGYTGAIRCNSATVSICFSGWDL